MENGNKCRNRVSYLIKYLASVSPCDPIFPEGPWPTCNLGTLVRMSDVCPSGVLDFV